MKRIIGNKIPSLAKKRIKKTEKVLIDYETTFKEYMTGHCNRVYFELGSHVLFGTEKVIICGWNRSCNYDVYRYDLDKISNVHPSDLTKFEKVEDD